MRRYQKAEATDQSIANGIQGEKRSRGRSDVWSRTSSESGSLTVKASELRFHQGRVVSLGTKSNKPQNLFPWTCLKPGCGIFGQLRAGHEFLFPVYNYDDKLWVTKDRKGFNLEVVPGCNELVSQLLPGSGTCGFILGGHPCLMTHIILDSFIFAPNFGPSDVFEVQLMIWFDVSKSWESSA